MISTRKILKRHLPALLKRHRRENDRLSVMRKRDAHNPRLPEVQRAKAKAVHDAAVQQAIANRIAADARKAALAAAKAELKEAVEAA